MTLTLSFTTLQRIQTCAIGTECSNYQYGNEKQGLCIIRMFMRFIKTKEVQMNFGILLPFLKWEIIKYFNLAFEMSTFRESVITL